ncbi:MAG: division/cell wall cluster transcriptional repressor MraZ [Deltaproteobacteria bacterium]|nr:division/cell wall cluster transcriptional repressor MraZ [Deltaproteobacteria bacterium]
MFLGKYASMLDSNNRLSVPSAFSDKVLDGVYMTQGFDRNLLVLTTDAFEEIYRRVKSLNIADPLARLLLRMILSTADRVETDKDGFITIPVELIQFANLDKEVLFIGQGDYFELWSPGLWRKQEAQLNDADTNATRFSTLTIATR